MKAKDFRAELVKRMPGYKWTIRRGRSGPVMTATGSQSSGSNRTSTLEVRRTEKDGKVVYAVRSAGYGLKAEWLASAENRTLASALRDLQDHYGQMAGLYESHRAAMELGRTDKLAA